MSLADDLQDKVTGKSIDDVLKTEAKEKYIELKVKNFLADERLQYLLKSAAVDPIMVTEEDFIEELSELKEMLKELHFFQNKLDEILGHNENIEFIESPETKIEIIKGIIVKSENERVREEENENVPSNQEVDSYRHQRQLEKIIGKEAAAEFMKSISEKKKEKETSLAEDLKSGVNGNSSEELSKADAKQKYIDLKVQNFEADEKLKYYFKRALEDPSLIIKDDFNEKVSKLKEKLNELYTFENELSDLLGHNASIQFIKAPETKVEISKGIIEKCEKEKVGEKDVETSKGLTISSYGHKQKLKEMIGEGETEKFVKSIKDKIQGQEI